VREPVEQRHLDVDDRHALTHATLQRRACAPLHRGNELGRNDATLDVIDERDPSTSG